MQGLEHSSVQEVPLIERPLNARELDEEMDFLARMVLNEWYLSVGRHVPRIEAMLQIVARDAPFVHLLVSRAGELHIQVCCTHPTLHTHVCSTRRRTTQIARRPCRVLYARGRLPACMQRCACVCTAHAFTLRRRLHRDRCSMCWARRSMCRARRWMCWAWLCCALGAAQLCMQASVGYSHSAVSPEQVACNQHRCGVGLDFRLPCSMRHAGQCRRLRSMQTRACMQVESEFKVQGVEVRPVEVYPQELGGAAPQEAATADARFAAAAALDADRAPRAEVQTKSLTRALGAAALTSSELLLVSAGDSSRPIVHVLCAFIGNSGVLQDYAFNVWLPGRDPEFV
jgi:hypothetical protein